LVKRSVRVRVPSLFIRPVPDFFGELIEEALTFKTPIVNILAIHRESKFYNHSLLYEIYVISDNPTTLSPATESVAHEL
jgi:hypothetical protein